MCCRCIIERRPEKTLTSHFANKQAADSIRLLQIVGTRPCSFCALAPDGQSYGILTPMSTTFAELGLNEQILAGVEALGFTQPTPVQSQAIPLVLEGRDLVASAQTGTGKTAAFALPALQRIMGLSTDDPTPEVATSPATADTTDAPEQDEAAPKRRRRDRKSVV